MYNNLNWKDYSLNEIFKLKRGVRLKSEDRRKGKLPYFSASQYNNGLTDLISNPKFESNKNVIITTFCDAYFIDFKFTASDEITILSNENLKKLNGLFVSNMIMKNKSKYAFGWKAFSDRLKKQKILLPTKKR